MERFSKKKENKEFDTRATIRIKDPLPQKIVNIRYRKQQVLSNAIMNPVEDNTFPKYFLPRTGSMLISKNEPPIAKKRKKEEGDKFFECDFYSYNIFVKIFFCVYFY
jgi:hypothetical protein